MAPRSELLHPCGEARRPRWRPSWFSRAPLPVAGLLLLALGQAGCASARAFMPAEHVTALSPSGRHLAAEYVVREGPDLIAEVKVWSNGATRNVDDQDDGATVVRVGFEIQNRSRERVRLHTRELFLESVTLDDGELDRVRPLRVDGSPELAARQERELTVLFQLPGNVHPSDVRSYRVAWQLTNGGVYTRKTPFVFVRTRDDALYPPHYYAYPPSYYYWGPPPRWHWGYRYRAWPGWRYRPYYP